MEQTIKDSVRRAMADDYESFELISEMVNDPERDGIEGVRPTPNQVTSALAELIKDGDAQAYVLSSQEPYATKVEFSQDRLHELWYYLTKQGTSIVKKQNEHFRKD
jgi:hypothetical protein